MRRRELAGWWALVVMLLSLALALSGVAHAQTPAAKALADKVTSRVMGDLSGTGLSINYYRVNKVKVGKAGMGTVYFTLAYDGYRARLFKSSVVCGSVRGAGRVCYAANPESIG